MYRFMVLTTATVSETAVTKPAIEWPDACMGQRMILQLVVGPEVL